MRIDRGTVLLLDLGPTAGREQQGTRPCVVVSDPEVASDQRFPVIAVVPLTGTLGAGSLYPELRPGTSGLTRPSCALVDHVRSVDKRRVRRLFGQVGPDEMRAIDDGLRSFLGL